MKQGEPLQRRTPLAPGDKRLRRARMREGGSITRKAPKSREWRDTGPSPEVRAMVRARSGGMCERCFLAAAVDQHHRCGRQMGGSRHTPWINLPSAIVDACDPCHDEVTFGDLVQAREDGWVVPRGIGVQLGGLSSVPVRDTSGRLWLLLDDGRKIPC